MSRRRQETQSRPRPASEALSYQRRQIGPRCASRQTRRQFPSAARRQPGDAARQKEADQGRDRAHRTLDSGRAPTARPEPKELPSVFRSPPRKASHWAFQAIAKVEPPKVKTMSIVPQSDRPLPACEARSEGTVVCSGAGSNHADSPGDVRSAWPAADACGDGRVPQGQVAATLTRSWSIVCSRRRTMANAGAAIGSTSPAMPTPKGIPTPIRALDRVPLSRLRDPRVQRRQAVGPLHRRSRSPATR